MGGYNRIFLASGSPRRRKLLSDAGLLFSVFENNVDENINNDSPLELCKLLAVKKCQAAITSLIKMYPDQTFTVIAADTVVCVKDTILGKPKDTDDARQMLRLLSGREHSVYTGVSIIEIIKGKISKNIDFVEETKVLFDTLFEKEIDAYIMTQEPFDKAGSYAIQGIGSRFVKGIIGDYNNVVGFPINRILRAMKENNLIYEHRKCRAAVFDLDGTIMNTIDSLALSGNMLLKVYGKSPLPLENYFYYVGDGAKKLVERILNASGIDASSNLDEAYSVYSGIFSKNRDYKVLPYMNIVEVLKELKARGIKLFVYTNKPDKEAKKILNTMLGEDMFDDIRGDIGSKDLKPDPKAVLKWSQMYDIATEQILYLGDTDTDMKTGNNAGAYTVGVSWGFRKRAELFTAGAYDVIDEPSQILNYF